MSLNKVTISQYHSGFSLSLVWVTLSAACSLESFFILGCFGGPLSTVGLHCAVECDSTAHVAFADPYIVPYTHSSSDVHRCRLTSSSQDLLSDK